MMREEAIKKLPPFRLYGEDAQRGWLLDCLVALDLIIEFDDANSILCKDDPDWDWWLKQPPEFKSKVIRLVRGLLA